MYYLTKKEEHIFERAYPVMISNFLIQWYKVFIFN